MSMMCSVLGRSTPQIRALRATPSLATTVAVAELGDDGEDISQLGPLQVALDLQKSWHLLHYLFTGSLDDTSSPGGALLAGEVLGEDVGYGPARLLDEIETTEFARLLAGVEVAGLQARVNVKEMAETSRGGRILLPALAGLRRPTGAAAERIVDLAIVVSDRCGQRALS